MKKHYFRLVVAVVTFAVGVAAAFAWLYHHRTASQQQLLPAPISRLKNARPDTLLWDVRQAKERGERVYELGSISCGMGVSTLDEAVRNHTIVVAQPIEKKVLLEDENNVRSWYRFKIIETTSQKPITDFGRESVDNMRLPDEMLPAGEDEFLMAQGGGSMEIEGVKIIYGSNSPQFKVSEKYLLFLEMDAEKRFAFIPWSDDIGIFTVDDAGNIRSTDNEPYDPRVRSYNLRDKMESRLHNSLQLLRTYVSLTNKKWKK